MSVIVDHLRTEHERGDGEKMNDDPRLQSPRVTGWSGGDGV